MTTPEWVSILEVNAKLSREGHVAVAPVLYHRLGCTRLFRYASEDAGARTKTMGSLGDASVTSGGI
jgi:dienelactone hydrolase